jgi:hypothetical protein
MRRAFRFLISLLASPLEGRLLEGQILALLKEMGPLTGAETLENLACDPLFLWRSCRLSKVIAIRSIGRRYLRLDEEVEGFARLSPSILREFLTYSVIGHSGDLASIRSKSDQIAHHIERVSAAKQKLAKNIFSAALSRLEDETFIKERACVILAGDIVHNMAHDVPRPERSTGRLVKGSDLDLVIIVDDLFPKDSMNRMDEVIYQEKQRVLMAPHVREEIDYVVKDLDRVREQMRFDTFKRMVACKILQEGIFLYGREDLFMSIKTMLRERGIAQKLLTLEDRARKLRMDAEAYLLLQDTSTIRKEGLSLFYPADESEEFE